MSKKYLIFSNFPSYPWLKIKLVLLDQSRKTTAIPSVRNLGSFVGEWWHLCLFPSRKRSLFFGKQWHQCHFCSAKCVATITSANEEKKIFLFNKVNQQLLTSMWKREIGKSLLRKSNYIPINDMIIMIYDAYGRF